MKGASCQRDADNVVDERPEEILPNHVNRLLAQFYGFRKCQEVVAHQRNLRHIHRHIRSLSYCHAHIGKGQRLGVVDSVAYHRYLLAFVLNACHADSGRALEGQGYVGTSHTGFRSSGYNGQGQQSGDQ